MKLNSSRRRTIGDSLEARCGLDGLELTEENLQNLRENFRGRLKQFHLDDIYEPDDVLNEVVIRLMKTPQKEGLHPEAWAKGIGLNVVRELKRKSTKYQTVEPNTLESVVASGEEISLALEKQEESERVREALKDLKLEEQELLNLQFFKELSWQQIADHLARKGRKVSVGTLRKRGQRAKEQLREVYFEKFLR